MKLFRSFLLSAFLLTASFGLQAQQNYGIAYQAVARDAGGDALENATLDVRFTLLDAASSSVWTETHSGVLTDEFGLINLTIGSVAGAADLAAVDWSAGGYSFQVEVNSGGGFASFGMMAVTAVPVAMFAASAPEGTADSLSVVLAQEIADRAAGDAGLASDNTALAGLIATNTGNIATNGSGISANAGGISTNAGAISTNAGAISTNAGGISTNAGAISTNAGEISTNASGISTNAGAISTNAGEISTNAGGISTNAGAISTNAGEISTNAGGISTNAGAISTNAGEISTNAGGISTNAGAISTNAGEISTNASGISTNAGAISTNAGEISTNASGIGTNAGAISQLQTDLGTETTNRVAEDATLLGLIQSNDGELLALNTSVGQLQSDLSDLSDLVDANDHFDFDGGVLSTEGDIDQLQFGSTVSVNTSGASSVQLAVTGKILTTNLTVQNDLTVSDNITAGSASFTGNVLSTEAPIADDHLANKGYVDNVVGNEIAGYTQAIIDEAARATLAEAALGVRIDSLDGAHSSEIAQVQSNLDAEILATNGDVTSLQGQVDSNDGDITSIQGALDTLAADVNANSAATVSNFLAIQNNDGDITALQGVDDTLALDVNANAAAILSNDGDISTNAGAISTNASDISTNAGDISTNAAAILANDGDIATNLSAIQANDGDITALQDVDDTLALDVNANAAAILANDGDIASNLSAIQGNDGDISTNAGAISTNASDISTNAGDISTNAAAILANDGDIAANLSAIQANDGDITALQDVDDTLALDVNANAAAILANDGDIASNLSAIGSNDTDITNLQGALAAEIASTNGDVTNLQGQIDVNESDITTLQGVDDTLAVDVLTNAAATVSNFLAIQSNDTDISGLQSDIDQNELDSDAADVTLQGNINTVQNDVNQNELDSDAADGTLQDNINTVQGDVDQNETDSDAADVTLQGNINTVQNDVNQNEIDSDAADVTLQGNINTVQNDVNQNEIDSDAADVTLQGNINTVQDELDASQTGAGLGTDGAYTANGSTTYLTGSTSLVDADEDLDAAMKALQDDVDANELASDNAESTLQGNINTVQNDVNQNEIDSDAADVTLQGNINTVQNDVNQNELDSDAADVTLQGNINTVQNDVNQNELDSDAADGTLQDNINTVQGDVDQNEIDSDAADVTLQGNINTVQDELDASQTGAGLGTDGAYTANGSTTYLTGSTSLVDADEDLDAAMKALQDDVDANELASDNAETGLQSELDASQTGAGLGTNGAYTANGSTTYLTGSTSLVDADEDLDAAMKALQDDVDANELASDNAETALQSELDASQTGAGLGTDGTYTANGSTTYLTGSTSLVDADEDLDAAIYSESLSRSAGDVLLNSSIANNTVNVAGNTASITSLSTSVSTNASDIGTLQGDLASEISATNSDVTSLQGQIDNLPTSPAAIAAEVENNDYFDEPIPGVVSAESQVTMLVLPSLAVTGATTLDDVDIDGSLEVSSISTAQVETTGDVIVGDDVITTDDVSVGDRLTVTGTSAFTGAATFSGGITGTVTGTVSDISNHDTGDLTEGSNLYYTDTRSRASVSATDAGGDGSFSYDNSTGVMTYTGPSAAETRAHFSGSTGVTITNGAVAIGQAVGTSDNVTFNNVTANLTGNASGNAGTVTNGVYTTSSVAALSDVSSAGSGAIITSAERTKLAGVDDNATANQTDAHLVSRANHTGTQTAATISDFDAEVSNNTSVTANTAKVSADGLVTTHSDVTSAGSGAIITTVERSKLGAIEANATADQTGAEIKTAYEAETKAFTDAQFDKLAAIDDNATANQTDAHLVSRANHTGTQAAATISDFDAEVSNNTSVTANTAKVSADGLVTTHSDVTSAGSGAIITTVERSKLGAIEANATADQTGAEIKTAYEAETKAFTDAQFDKLAAIDDNATANQTDAHLVSRANHTGTQAAATISDFDAEVSNNTSVTANTAKVSADGLVTTHSDVTSAGSGAIITTVERSKLGAIEANATADQTGAEIKTAYEAETKAFTDAQFDKLAAIDDNATANQTDAHLVSRANHTGTQTAATISDFDAEVSNNTSVTANTAKVSADGLVTTHSDVTSAGSGAIITTVERSKLGAIEANATADQTGAEIKTAYEAETKAFTDAQFDKLAAIDDNATANQTDAHLVSRANHTGTQAAATISDFDAEVSNNTSVTANTAKVSADGLVTTHSDVTSAGSGAIITTVERSKLGAIEANATADQTGAEIKTAYEAETKAFTDAQFDKLAAIEDNADVTDATNVAAAGAVMNTGNETIAGTKTFSSTIQGNLSGNVTGQVSDISNHNTGALAEGSNLYYTDARSRLAVSATDAGGDGSFSYNNTTGVMTYTGPSAADTRAHFSGGTGVTITNGAVAIGQAVAASDAVTFASATTTGNASVGGTLGATGATTLGSTLDVAGAGEFDSTLGTDGNFRVGASGASTFQVNATSGALSTSGDISTTGGVQTGTLIATGTALLQGSTTITTLNVSNYLTLNNEPLLSSHAATKFYVDSEIDSHAHTMPQAYSFMSNGTYTSLGADLGVSAVTITVTGANLAAGTYKLHLDGEELALTVTVGSSTSVSFDLVDSDISGMLTASGRATTTGLFATQLSIDGVATGLTIFVNL